jgi:hypothetical protein
MSQTESDYWTSKKEVFEVQIRINSAGLDGGSSEIQGLAIDTSEFGGADLGAWPKYQRCDSQLRSMDAQLCDCSSVRPSIEARTDERESVWIPQRHIL